MRGAHSQSPVVHDVPVHVEHERDDGCADVERKDERVTVEVVDGGEDDHGDGAQVLARVDEIFEVVGEVAVLAEALQESPCVRQTSWLFKY